MYIHIHINIYIYICIYIYNIYIYIHIYMAVFKLWFPTRNAKKVLTNFIVVAFF